MSTDRPMRPGSPDRTERFVRGLYRLLRRAYPRSFRDDFGRDMDETFADQWRAARARGEWSMARLAIVTMTDTVAEATRARMTSLPAPSDMLHLQDVRYAFRLLARSPLFTLLTLVVLAGGMGVTVFTFSFLYTAMLRPIPLSGGERIVRLQAVEDGSVRSFDAADFARMRPQIATLSDVGLWNSRDVVMGSAEGGGARRVLETTAVEWTLFDATRTPPALGRAFRPDDEAPGAAPVIVLSHRTWILAFGGDSTVVGRRVLLNGVSTEVVGVMPPGYGFPVAADSWVPLGSAVREATEPGRYAVSAFGRLADGATREQASQELETLLRRARSDRPPVAADSSGTRLGVLVRSFPMAQMGDEGPYVFGILNLMAVLILLLACVNVANLLLARANERSRELAVRLALGASRARLAMQALWEPVALVTIGGGLATALAAWGLGVVNRWAQQHMEGNLAFWWVWGMDTPTIIAAGGFMTVTIAALGGVMAVRATSTRFHEVLRDSGTRAGGRGAGRAARALVVTQVATVTVLLFFGVLSGIAAHRFANMNPGYDTTRLLASSVEPEAARYATTDARRALWTRLYDGMSAWPEVEHVVVRARLGEGDDESGALEFGDGRSLAAGATPRAWVQGVLGSLEALGIATLEGRPLTPGDRGGAGGGGAGEPRRSPALLAGEVARRRTRAPPRDRRDRRRHVAHDRRRGRRRHVRRRVLARPQRGGGVRPAHPARCRMGHAPLPPPRRRGGRPGGAAHDGDHGRPAARPIEGVDLRRDPREVGAHRPLGLAALRHLLRLRPAARGERDLRAHGPVDRDAHPRDRGAPRPRGLRPEHPTASARTRRATAGDRRGGRPPTHGPRRVGLRPLLPHRPLARPLVGGRGLARHRRRGARGHVDPDAAGVGGRAEGRALPGVAAGRTSAAPVFPSPRSRRENVCIPPAEG
ncbi:MAG: ABC transporter permease [Gemmatimonadetes bacterium]|nr:ABC transporter permease [Gemmatimonadota bacterium]